MTDLTQHSAVTVPLAIGIVGAGRWGQRLAESFCRIPGCHLAGICDPQPAHRARVSHLAPVFADVQAMSEAIALQAVCIASPPETHFPLVEHALQQGLHVWCEKPLALSGAQCRALDVLARRQRRCLFVDCLPVYLEEVSALRGRLPTNLQCIRTLRTSRREEAETEELLWDLAPHDLAILHDWLGPIARHWELSSLASGDAELRTVDEILPRLELRFGRRQSAERHITLRTAAGVERCLAQQQATPEPLQVAFEHFAKCILTGGQPRTGGLAAAWAADILTAVLT